MQFVESFKSLGYQVANQRQDWSAEKEDGICLTLWTKEVDWKLLVLDTALHCGDIAEWGSKPGNAKRIEHIKRAVSEFEGKIDVIKVDGFPGEGYGNATPWSPQDRKGFSWKITSFDPKTGHFRAEAKIW